MASDEIGKGGGDRAIVAKAGPWMGFDSRVESKASWKMDYGPSKRVHHAAARILNRIVREEKRRAK